MLRQARLLVLLLMGTIITAALLSAAAAPPKRPNQACAAWQDDFSLTQIDASRWVIANGRAPGYIPNYHVGYYQPGHVSVGGGSLAMLLTQENGLVDKGYGVISRGAMIYTKQKCGYGTYQWTMRMSSTANGPTAEGYPTSGSVSAGFVYGNNSETEIDFEFSGQDPDTLWLVNWLNTNPRTDPTEANETYTAVQPFVSTSSFHTYKFVWQPGKITYYVDDQPQAEHTTNVPSAAAYFMINHWGTDSRSWGGYATVGTARYFYIDRVSYTPLR